MDDGHNIDKQFVDRSWNEMERLLDRELPVKERKRKFFIWLLAGMAFLFLAFFLYLKDSGSLHEVDPIYVQHDESYEYTNNSKRESDNQIVNDVQSKNTFRAVTEPATKEDITSLKETNRSSKTIIVEENQLEKETGQIIPIESWQTETRTAYQNYSEKVDKDILPQGIDTRQDAYSTPIVNTQPRADTNKTESASEHESEGILIAENISQSRDEIKSDEGPKAENNIANKGLMLTPISRLMIADLVSEREPLLMNRQVILKKNKEVSHPIGFGIYADIGQYGISKEKSFTSYGAGLEIRQSHRRLGWSGHLGYHVLQDRITSQSPVLDTSVDVSASPSEGSSEMDFTTPLIYDVQRRLDYLYVDLLIEYPVFRRLKVEMGPYTNFRLGGHSERDLTSLKDSRSGVLVVSKNKLYRRNTYGVKLGASLDMTSKLLLYGQYGYGLGVYKYFEGPANTFNTGNSQFTDEFQNTMSQYTLGLRWRL